VLRKVGTARRVLKDKGWRGVAAVLSEKARAACTSLYYWCRYHLTGKIVELKGNLVALDGCLFSVDHPAISTAIKGCVFIGEYERPERMMLRKFIEPKWPLIELGGCIGVVSCLANKVLLNPRDHIVVEANADLIPLIEKNRDRNGCRFTVLHGAIAYGTNEVDFHVERCDVVKSRLGLGTGESIKVPTISLQRIIDEYGFERCNLICDIEGAEIDLINNEASLLSSRVSTLIIEIHKDLLQEQDLIALFSKLKRMGFSEVQKESDTYVFRNASM